MPASDRISAANRLNAEAVKPQGTFLRQHARSQWGTPQGIEHVAGNTGSEQTGPRFSNRLTRYLRAVDFGFIRSRFTSLQKSQTANRRAKFLFYAVPMTVSLGIGLMHLTSQSFLIYLKYQAMVDAYYYNVVLNEKPAV